VAVDKFGDRRQRGDAGIAEPDGTVQMPGSDYVRMRNERWLHRSATGVRRFVCAGQVFRKGTILGQPTLAAACDPDTRDKGPSSDMWIFRLLMG